MHYAPFVNNFIILIRLAFLQAIEDHVDFVLVKPFVNMFRENVSFHEVHLQCHDQLFLCKNTHGYKDFANEPLFIITLHIKGVIKLVPGNDLLVNQKLPDPLAIL